MPHKYTPNELKYRLPDTYSRTLFLKIFRDKYHLHVYRYKGTQWKTLFCDAEPEVQKRAWSEFATYEGRLQRALSRAVDQLLEKWEHA